MRKLLGVRGFRNLWIGVALSVIGDWLYLTALAWYVLERGGNATEVSAVTAAGLLPILILTLAGGVAADRWPKRTMLRLIVTAQLIVSASFAVLTAMGVLSVPGLAAFAFVLGCLTTIWRPIELSYLPDLVPAEHLDKAMGLSMSASYTGRTVGPALAGVLIGLVGTQTIFVLNSLSFLAPAIALATISVVGSPVTRRQSPLRTLKESLKAVSRDRVLRPLWLCTAAMSLLAMPTLVLIPVYAQDVFNAGATSLGALMAAVGLGQVVGAVVVSSGSGDVVKRTGLLQLAGYVAMGLILTMFAVSPTVILAAACLFFFGTLHGFLSPRVHTIVQRRSGKGSGTAQSLFLVVFGIVPIGQLVLGYLAVRMGVVAASTAFAMSFLAVAILLLATARGLRKYPPSTD